jgi:hypothetical protein
MKKKEVGGPYTNKEKEGSNYPSAFHSERKKKTDAVKNQRIIQIK